MVGETRDPPFLVCRSIARQIYKSIISWLFWENRRDRFLFSPFKIGSRFSFSAQQTLLQHKKHGNVTEAWVLSSINLFEEKKKRNFRSSALSLIIVVLYLYIDGYILEHQEKLNIWSCAPICIITIYEVTYVFKFTQKKVKFHFQQRNGVRMYWTIIEP